MSKSDQETIITAEENMIIYFGLRQKKFVRRAHKAHFWTCKKNQQNQQKLLISTIKIGDSQKLLHGTSATKKIYEIKHYAYI